jgi:HEAT repeat protein
VFERAGDTIQKALLDQAATIPEERSLNLFRYASLMGCITNDWNISDKMAAIFQQRFSNWSGISDVLSQQVFNYIRQLNSDDREASKCAEAALMESGANATEALVLAMGTQNLRIRKSIIRILSEIGDENAVECLVGALGDRSGKVRRFAMSGVLKLSTPAIPLLRKAVKSDNPRLRSNATKALSMLDENDARDAALTALTDRDPKVRKTGVKTLSRVGDKRLVNHLQNVLDDESEQVSFEAAVALAKIGAKGIKTLKAALYSDSQSTRRAAAHGLAEIGDASGVDLLVETLGSEGGYSWLTPRLLIELGDERGIEGLLTFVESHLHEEAISDATILAARALGQIKHTRAAAILKEMLFAHRDKKIRRTTIKALQQIGTPEAIETLIEAVQGRDGPLRQQAGSALAKIGEAVIPRLREILAVTTGKPRKSVIGVLKMLGENKQ